jgi:RNA polymerase sigma factor (sigma-70 family)
MAIRQMNRIIENLRQTVLVQDGAGRSDAQLLECFIARHDEAAFETIVRRHGPMVLSVCRRILRHSHDAEDAFQATFLVLVRKASTLKSKELLANWLYGVAYQTSLKARAVAVKHQARQRQVNEMPEPIKAQQDRWDDLQPLLDHELSSLPDKYRVPIVLCDLEGKTRKEAAQLLGLPEGTLSSRLARARTRLARRLARHGFAFSAGAIATLLSQSAASACVPTALLATTVQAATLIAVGKAAATAIVSAKVAALTEGVLKAMFLTNLKTAFCAFGMALIIGVAGVALAPGGEPMPTVNAQAGPAKSQPDPGVAKADPDVGRLVRQLGSRNFASREASEKALRHLGARAAGAVRAGMGDAEVAKRCKALWPKLWETEIARPDADRLAGYAHPLWMRFRKTVGDDAGSRTLYAEMVLDVGRFAMLETAEADPAKAGDGYAAELKKRVEGLKRGYEEAEAAAGNKTGLLWPASGILSRGEFAALLFLGTFPSTAAVTFRQADDHDRFAHHNVFGLALDPTDRKKSEAIPPVVRRLFAAWLGTRTDPNPIQFGTHLALYHVISEAAPAARKNAADARLDPTARGFALLTVGRFGAVADLALLEKAFSDTRVFHATNDTSEAGQKRPVEALVSDTAIASALHLFGQHPADFGFPLLEKYKARGPDTLAKYHMLGFFDDDTRQAAHKKARAWLNEHRNDIQKERDGKR